MLREADLTPLPPALDWQCPKIEPGAEVTGVVAGKMWSIRTHTVRTISKPCANFASGGKLRCFCAEREVNVRTVCYLPLLTKDGDRLVILLSAVTGYKWRGLKPGTLITVTKPKTVKQPLRVTLANSHNAMQEWVLKLKKDCNHDILEYLCHLWQIHALTQHLGFTPRRSLALDGKHPIAEAPYAPRFVSDLLPGYDIPHDKREAA